jgi:hypothetical protein
MLTSSAILIYAEGVRTLRIMNSGEDYRGLWSTPQDKSRNRSYSPQLSLAAIHNARSYYNDNPEEIDVKIEANVSFELPAPSLSWSVPVNPKPLITGATLSLLVSCH